MTEGKAKTYDDGKPALAHLPWGGLLAVCEAQAYGHKKYGDFNNYRKGMEVTRNLSCAMRHITAYLAGETIDPESGVPHLGLGATRLLFVLQNQHDGVAIDDRFVMPPKVVKANPADFKFADIRPIDPTPYG